MVDNIFIFSQLKEFGDEDFEVSFNNYPTSDAIIVKIGLGLKSENRF